MLMRERFLQPGCQLLQDIRVHKARTTFQFDTAQHAIGNQSFYDRVGIHHACALRQID